VIIGFQDTVENVGDVFFGTQCNSYTGLQGLMGKTGLFLN